MSMHTQAHICLQVYPKIFYWDPHELKNYYSPHKADVSDTLGYFKQLKVPLLRKLILVSIVNLRKHFLDHADSIGHIQKAAYLAQNSYVSTNTPS